MTYGVLNVFSLCRSNYFEYHILVTVVEIVRHGLSDVKGAVVKIPVGMKNESYGNNSSNYDLNISWVYDL